MPNQGPHWGFDTQSTAEDVAAFRAFVATGSYDDDDRHLGCEAMIGELVSGFRGCWQK